MRALQVHTFGDPASLNVSEIPEPEPGESEVKLRVESVGIGYFDGLLVKGEYQIKPPLPFVPGSAVAGVVETLGSGVTHLNQGDRVTAFSLMGGLAEKAVFPAASVMPLPAGIDLDDAANFFIAYATGAFGLLHLAKLHAGEVVLVLGAAGTTGSAAIEIANAQGAEVIACASTDQKRQHCLAAGADHAVDYTDPDWRKHVNAISDRGVDVVYDPVGGDLVDGALRAMAPGGRYLVIGFVAGIASAPLNLPLLKRCSIIGVNWGGEAMANPAIVPPVMEQIVNWALAGKLKTRPDQVFSLAEGGHAFRGLFNRTSLGKIVVKPST